MLDDLLKFIEVDSEATIIGKKLNLGKTIDVLELSEDIEDKLKGMNYNYIWQMFVFLDKETLNEKSYMGLGKLECKEISNKLKGTCGFDIVDNVDDKKCLDEVQKRVSLCKILKFLH